MNYYNPYNLILELTGAKNKTVNKSKSGIKNKQKKIKKIKHKKNILSNLTPEQWYKIIKRLKKLLKKKNSANNPNQKVLIPETIDLIEKAKEWGGGRGETMEIEYDDKKEYYESDDEEIKENDELPDIKYRKENRAEFTTEELNEFKKANKEKKASGIIKLFSERLNNLMANPNFKSEAHKIVYEQGLKDGSDAEGTIKNLLGLPNLTGQQITDIKKWNTKRKNNIKKYEKEMTELLKTENLNTNEEKKNKIVLLWKQIENEKKTILENKILLDNKTKEKVLIEIFKDKIENRDNPFGYYVHAAQGLRLVNDKLRKKVTKIEERLKQKFNLNLEDLKKLTKEKLYKKILDNEKSKYLFWKFLETPERLWMKKFIIGKMSKGEKITEPQEFFNKLKYNIKSRETTPQKEEMIVEDQIEKEEIKDISEKLKENEENLSEKDNEKINKIVEEKMKEIENLKSELDKILEENEKLKNKLTEKDSEISTTKKQLGEKDEEISKTKLQLTEKEKNIEQLTKNIEILNSDIKKLNDVTLKNKDLKIKEYEDKIKNFEKEIQQNKEDIQKRDDIISESGVEVLNKKNDELEEIIKGLKIELGEYIKKFKDTKSLLNADQKRERSKSKAKEKEQKSSWSFDLLKGAANAFSGVVTRGRSGQVEKNKKEDDYLKYREKYFDEIDNLKKEIVTLRGLNSKGNPEEYENLKQWTTEHISELEEKLKQKEKDISDYEKQIGANKILELFNQKEKNKISNLFIKMLKNKGETLSKKVAQLETDKLTNTENLKKTLVEIKKKYDLDKQEINKLKIDVENYKNENLENLEKLKKNGSVKINEVLNRQKADFEKEKKELLEAKKQLEKTLEEQEEADNKIKKWMENSRRENDELLRVQKSIVIDREKQIEKLEKELNEQISKLETEKINLTNSLEAKSKKEKLAIEKKVEEKEEQIKKLKLKKKSYKNEKIQYNKEVDNLKETNKELENSIIDINKKLKETTNLNDLSNIELTELREKIKSFEEKEKKFFKDLEDHNLTKNELKQKNNENILLNSEKDTLNTLLTSLKRNAEIEKEKLNEQITQLKKDLHNEKNKKPLNLRVLDEIESKEKQKTEYAQSLETNLDEKQREINKLKDDLKKLDLKISILDGDQKNKDLKITEFISKIWSLDVEKKSLEGQINNLETQLKDKNILEKATKEEVIILNNEIWNLKKKIYDEQMDKRNISSRLDALQSLNEQIKRQAKNDQIWLDSEITKLKNAYALREQELISLRKINLAYYDLENQIEWLKKNIQKLKTKKKLLKEKLEIFDNQNKQLILENEYIKKPSLLSSFIYSEDENKEKLLKEYGELIRKQTIKDMNLNLKEEYKNLDDVIKKYISEIEIKNKTIDDLKNILDQKLEEEKKPNSPIKERFKTVFKPDISEFETPKKKEGSPEINTKDESSEVKNTEKPKTVYNYTIPLKEKELKKSPKKEEILNDLSYIKTHEKIEENNYGGIFANDDEYLEKLLFEGPLNKNGKRRQLTNYELNDYLNEKYNHIYLGKINDQLIYFSWKEKKIKRELGDLIKIGPVQKNQYTMDLFGQKSLPLGLLYYDFYLNYEKPYIQKALKIKKIEITKEQLKKGAEDLFNHHYFYLIENEEERKKEIQNLIKRLENKNNGFIIKKTPEILEAQKQLLLAEVGGYKKFFEQKTGSELNK